MDRRIKKDNPEGRGYYYYDSGYNYGGSGGPDLGPQRSFQDYLLIVRERIWWILVIFVLVILVTTLDLESDPTL